MITVEDKFEADKIQAAIDYLEFKGKLNEIKAQAIDEFINHYHTNGIISMYELRRYAKKLRGDK
jgi:hypothetical protein